MHQNGEGSFTIVYLAEQEKPVRRRVALKIIKLGMDTSQVIARFEAQRQASRATSGQEPSFPRSLNDRRGKDL